MSIEDAIKPMEESPGELNSTFIIFGKEGVGKTTLASSTPNTLLVDVEGGRGSLTKTDHKPDIMEPKDLTELGELYHYLKDNEDSYETVVLDTITEIEKMFLMELTEGSANPDLISQNEYLQGSTRLRRMARKFRNLKMNTIFLAHRRTDKDDTTGVREVSPGVMPSVMKDLNAFCDYIFYLGVDDDGNRYMLTQPTKHVTAKHRIGELPKKIEFGDSYEDMDFNKILKMIRGEE